MQVMLDNEQWTVNDNTSLMEISWREVSDKTLRAEPCRHCIAGRRTTHDGQGFDTHAAGANRRWDGVRFAPPHNP